MFPFVAGEAVLSLFPESAGEAVPTGANAVVLLFFGYSHQTWRHRSALGCQPDLGWAGAIKITIKKLEK